MCVGSNILSRCVFLCVCVLFGMSFIFSFKRSLYNVCGSRFGFGRLLFFCIFFRTPVQGTMVNFCGLKGLCIKRGVYRWGLLVTLGGSHKRCGRNKIC